VIKELIT